MRLKNPFKLGKSTSLSDCQVCHQTFPIGMGPSYFPRHDDPYFSAQLPGQPKVICLGIYFWEIQFQCNANCALRNENDHKEKPSQRGSWDPHGAIAFYICPAVQHYRCFKCYLPSMKSECATDTIKFLLHNNLTVPKTTPEEGIKQALIRILIAS